MNLTDYLQTTTQEALAKAVGVTQGMVHQWASGKAQITPERARDIEIATGGAVTRMELRPDVFGPLEGAAVASGNLTTDDGLPPEIRAQRAEAAAERQAA